MAAPLSAQQLPPQTPNANAPIASLDIELAGELTDSKGGAVTGKLAAFAYVTSAWRYLFGTFAQTSSAISPTFSLTAQPAYSQSDMQSLADQVALLSRQLGRSA
jgi:hypothetical protein